jgi:hypothetical protein
MNDAPREAAGGDNSGSPPEFNSKTTQGPHESIGISRGFIDFEKI